MKTKLPAAEIQAAVEHRLGPVSHFEPLAEGLVSQVFGFRRGAQALVARVGPSAAGFHKDAFAWRAFGSADLPIPEIVAIEPIGEAVLCISQRAAGVRLQDGGPPATRMAPAVIETLAALERADMTLTSGFGAFDSAGKAPCRTWREHLLRVADERVCDWAAIRDRLAGWEVGSALEIIERLAPADWPDRGLIHGDLGSANLISDGEAITGVIDWDRAQAGDPAYDQANLLFWSEARLQPVLEILMRRGAADPGWGRRMACYQLRIGLEELYDSLVGRTPVDAGWLLARCANLVKQAENIAE
jgi:hygromycin-B 4-O-kinase